jgi:hypothetical protein
VCVIGRVAQRCDARRDVGGSPLSVMVMGFDDIVLADDRRVGDARDQEDTRASTVPSGIPRGRAATCAGALHDRDVCASAIVRR